MRLLGTLMTTLTVTTSLLQHRLQARYCMTSTRPECFSLGYSQCKGSTRDSWRSLGLKEQSRGLKHAQSLLGNLERLSGGRIARGKHRIGVWEARLKPTWRLWKTFGRQDQGGKRNRCMGSQVHRRLELLQSLLGNFGRPSGGKRSRKDTGQVPGKSGPLLERWDTSASWRGVAREHAHKVDSLQLLKAGPEGGLWYGTSPSPMC